MSQNFLVLVYRHGLMFILLLIGLIITGKYFSFQELLLISIGYAFFSRLFLKSLDMYVLKSGHPLRHLNQQTRKLLAKHTINLLTSMLEIRDFYTSLHSSNVARYSMDVARSMGFSEDLSLHIYNGCLLHDLGKLYISDEILLKPDLLTADEYNQIKEHPLKGYQTLSHFNLLFENQVIRNIVLYHHERVDGNGYPKGLSHKQIPIEARIVAVCDAYDAMTSTRSYRKAMPADKAMEIIKFNIGSQFDPIVVDHFIRCVQNNQYKASELSGRTKYQKDLLEI